MTFLTTYHRMLESDRSNISTGVRVWKRRTLRLGLLRLDAPSNSSRPSCAEELLQGTHVVDGNGNG